MNIYEIRANAIMYYSMSDQHPNNIIIETTLNKDINSEVMEEAINSAIRRYPYFAVKLKGLDDRLVLEENKNRITLHDELAFDDKDGFLFCFTVKGPTLKVMLVHALTDVHGFMPFIKTILAEYHNKMNGCHDNYNGINPADSATTDAEFVEPLSLLPDGIIHSTGSVTNRERTSAATGSAYILPEFNQSSTHTYPYYLSLDNNVMKEFVKSMGGSFTSTISALFAKAINEVHQIPEESQIVCTNIIDRKPLLGCPASHYLSMHPASYAIDNELMQKPLDEIVAAIRNDLHETMKADVFVLARQMKQFIDYLTSMSSTTEKQKMCQQVVNSKQSNSTFTVSYVGVVDFDNLNDEVSHVHIQASASPILIEACAHGNTFDITLLQSMKASGDGQNADAYFEAFTKVLKNYGLLGKDKNEETDNYICYHTDDSQLRQE